MKLAKNAAQSWGNEEVLENLAELDSVRKQIFARTHVEQWAMNASVHCNNCANLEINDFKPVVEAFQDLFGLFSCSNCGGMLHLSLSGNSPSNLRCKCGNVNWILSKRHNLMCTQKFTGHVIHLNIDLYFILLSTASSYVRSQALYTLNL